MLKVVISDATTLIVLDKIGELDLLQKIYGALLTTGEVADEFGDQLPAWIGVQAVKDRKYQKFLETQVDKGEASAIALATEFDNVLLLVDDLKARKLAVQLQLKITGTLGVIHKAKQLGVVSKVKPLVDKLLSTNFRVADAIVEEFLKLNDE